MKSSTLADVRKSNPARTIELSCPSCGECRFGLRVMADEGLAAAHCERCSRDFLVLDSEDHWFDAIQAAYPRARRCPCKSESFQISCGYFFRDDGEITSVDLISACASCGKTRRQMSIDIDYGGTEDLLSRPLRFCKTPDLRYDLKGISLYLAQADMARVVGQLRAAHRCAFICCLREGETWALRALDVEGVQGMILSGHYLWIYASLLPLALSQVEVASSRSESAFWKRRELIRISSPTHMRFERGEGLLFYIQFANEYVDDDSIVRKSDAFCDATEALRRWLAANFVPWRGKDCFDNPAEHLRLFGDRFS